MEYQVDNQIQMVNQYVGYLNQGLLIFFRISIIRKNYLKGRRYKLWISPQNLRLSF